MFTLTTTDIARACTISKDAAWRILSIPFILDHQMIGGIRHFNAAAVIQRFKEKRFWNSDAERRIRAVDQLFRAEPPSYAK